eukprot:1060169-Alexandrium_andersonii.AAC.1
MAAGPIGAPPAPPPMAGSGADDSWANWRPYRGTQDAIGAPLDTGGATGSAGGQQDTTWSWRPRRDWWERDFHWWSSDRWWSRGSWWGDQFWDDSDWNARRW